MEQQRRVEEFLPLAKACVRTIYKTQPSIAKLLGDELIGIANLALVRAVLRYGEMTHAGLVIMSIRNAAIAEYRKEIKRSTVPSDYRKELTCGPDTTWEDREFINKTLKNMRADDRKLVRGWARYSRYTSVRQAEMGMGVPTRRLRRALSRLPKRDEEL